MVMGEVILGVKGGDFLFRKGGVWSRRMWESQKIVVLK